jgi:Flp pilus assembly protein TadD
MQPSKRAKLLRGSASRCSVGSVARRGQRDLSQTPGDDAAAAPFSSASWPLTILAASLIVLAAGAAYHNSFGGPFTYDDLRSIPANRTIRQLWPIWPVLSPPCDGETVGGRPLLNLSLAINYALGGLNVWGYHAVNLVIHIGAALLLFGILRRTFLMPILRDRFGKAATLLALASALLWTVHPLQTESVTYIVQRAESLAGLFYLLTLYCVIRGAALWYAAAVLACLLGMACKEVMVSAPLMVLLYDRTFLSGSFSEAFRRRWALYVGLAATGTLLAYLVFSTGLIGRQPELGSPDAWSYARSQPGVILHYLRLSLWPRPLCISYEWPVANTLGEILPAAIVVGLLLATTVWGLRAGRAWGFLGAWFLLILAPTSSVLPLKQLAFEHRMYLSLAAVVVLAAAGGYVLWEKLLCWSAGQRGQSPFSPEMPPGEVGLPAAKKGTVPGLATAMRWVVPLAVWAAALLALACATLARNRDYRSEVAVWQAAVDTFPKNSIAHYNLGIMLSDAGRTDEALEHYQEALRLQPDYAEAHANLGSVLARLGRTDGAIDHYQQALRLTPDDAETHNNLGLVLAGIGKTDEAIEHFDQVLRLKPLSAEGHNNLGKALVAAGRFDEAIEHHQQAAWLKPRRAEFHQNLAAAYAAAGRFDDAVTTAQRAIALAESAGQTTLAKDIQSRLELYRVGRAYREAPQSPRQTSR